MLTRANFLRGAVAALPMLAVGRAVLAETDQQAVIDGARKTLADLHRDKAFGNARALLQQARGVMIVPKLWKGGFIVGGEGGEGVVMLRGKTGWSDPAFYAIGSASFGLQIGLQQAEMVMLVMTEKGVQALLRDEFKLGAQAGIAVATLGSGVQGAIGGASGPDVVVWSSGTGVYGGLTLEGSLIRPQPADDRAFYGRPVTTREVLYGTTPSPKAAALHQALASLS
ncbi:MAG: lipid-binding SYLF domain-containing protein [Rhodospirillales bacterium]|nr:lipid-binding SYLF domain-containing protein [Rhodospirillales bacterium]MBN8901117.1 lipid-binding SYLF domain-containing protein [Rhodospirillales bacterium]